MEPEPEPEPEMLSPPPSWAPMVEVLLVVVDEVALEAVPTFDNQAASLTAGRCEAAACVLASLAATESVLVLDFLRPFFERLGASSSAAASSCHTCNLSGSELQFRTAPFCGCKLSLPSQSSGGTQISVVTQ